MIRPAMTIDTTRRGFLRGSIGAALLGKTGCAHEDVKGERVAQPSVVQRESASVRTTVNGTARTLEVDPDASALEVVRHQLGLTGCKQGCGHGACGACTMQLDGTPVATCILPATALHGRRVTTVEGLSAGGRLHAVQRAFMAEDALQCGYCTPGFVVEAAAFCDRWRTEHGKVAPDRDVVAAALAGHLCRCGAYEAIHRAVRAACSGAHDGEDPTPPRHDAREKVTGDALYTVDVAVPGMLHAAVLYSPHAHAKVTRLDWSRALAHPGVRGAIELLPKSRTVRYAGQEVMALAAVDERAAVEALRLVECDYDPQPAVIGMAAARATGAPLVYPRRAERKDLPNASEGPLLPEPWEGNVRGPLKIISKKKNAAGKVMDDARKAGRVVEGKYSTAVQCHTTLEPHAAVAKWESADKLTVWLSTQAVTHVAHDIAERWHLRRENVRVIAKYVGGGFGAKATLQSEASIAIELARVCNAPVRYALDRRAEIAIAGHRPATEIEVALATDAGGKMLAMRSSSYGDSGVAVGSVTSIMFRVIYPEAPRELLDFDVVNHTPPGKPFRGPGGPPAFWALEQTIDDVAHLRREDPIAVRQRWDPNPARKRLYAWAKDLPVWRERAAHAADKGRYRRGVGLACGAWFVFAEPRTRLQLDVVGGEVIASTASQDMGNGTRTVIAEMVARELGLRPSDINVRVGDSDYVHGPMSGGSRTTSSLVWPCIDACAQLREELAELATTKLHLRRARVGKDGVEHERGTVPWAKLLEIAPPTTVVGRRKRDQGGYFLPPLFGLAIEKYIAASVQIAEVEVDTRLGRVRVVETWLGVGSGDLVAPTLARSQAEGGVIQGIGYALYEERRLDPRAGYLLTGSLEDYRVPGIGDIPPIHVHFDQHGFEKVRGGSAGLGELVTITPAAAIGNAIFHATSWRPRDLPIRPDRVLQGVRG